MAKRWTWRKVLVWAIVILSVAMVWEGLDVFQLIFKVEHLGDDRSTGLKIGMNDGTVSGSSADVKVELRDDGFIPRPAANKTEELSWVHDLPTVLVVEGTHQNVTFKRSTTGRLTAVYNIQSYAATDERTQALVDLVRVGWDQDGDRAVARVVLNAGGESPIGFGGATSGRGSGTDITPSSFEILSVEATFYVPDGVAIEPALEGRVNVVGVHSDVTTSNNGTFRAEDVVGDVRVIGGQGSTHIENVRGSVWIDRTGAGSVTVSGVSSDVYAQVQFGPANVVDVDGSVDITTEGVTVSVHRIGGDLTVRGQRQSSLSTTANVGPVAGTITTEGNVNLRRIGDEPL